MRFKYFYYILIIIIVLFRASFFNIFSNIKNQLFIKNNNIELSILKQQNANLLNEFESLSNFNKNIKIDMQYEITNASKNNYGFDKLILNGNFKEGSEVINEDGLIGIITKSYSNYSEAAYLKNSSALVKINNIIGKISGSDEENLIIKELSNYSLINLNDNVYSINNTYVGRVINIIKKDIETIVIVKPIKTDIINYVGVITYDN